MINFDAFTIVKILPFLAVILLELVPRTLTGKFLLIYGLFFQSTKYQLIDDGLGDVLEDELEGMEGISDEDITQLRGRIQNEVGVDDEVLGELIKDYVIYAHDWLRSRISSFITFVSVVAILFGDALTGPRNLAAILVAAAFLLTGLFLFEFYIDYHFETNRPHEYFQKYGENFSFISKRIILINFIAAIVIIIVDILFA